MKYDPRSIDQIDADNLKAELDERAKHRRKVLAKEGSEEAIHMALDMLDRFVTAIEKMRTVNNAL